MRVVLAPEVIDVEDAEKLSEGGNAGVPESSAMVAHIGFPST